MNRSDQDWVNQENLVTSEEVQHRRIKPATSATFDKIFKDYRGKRLDDRDAWPDDELVGSERKAWD